MKPVAIPRRMPLPLKEGDRQEMVKAPLTYLWPQKGQKGICCRILECFIAFFASIKSDGANFMAVHSSNALTMVWLTR